MAIKEKDKKARKNYKKNITRKVIELYPTDEDIKRQLEKRLEAGEGVATYIKRLIREDIKRGEG